MFFFDCLCVENIGGIALKIGPKYKIFIILFLFYTLLCLVSVHNNLFDFWLVG